MCFFVFTWNGICVIKQANHHSLSTASPLHSSSLHFDNLDQKNCSPSAVPCGGSVQVNQSFPTITYSFHDDSTRWAYITTNFLSTKFRLFEWLILMRCSKTGTEISAHSLTDPKFGIEIERIVLFQSSMLIRNVVNGLSKSTLHRVDGRLVLLLLNQVQLSLPDDFNALLLWCEWNCFVPALCP